MKRQSLAGLAPGRIVLYQHAKGEGLDGPTLQVSELPALVVRVLEDEKLGLCVLQVFGDYERDGFTSTQVRAENADLQEANMVFRPKVNEEQTLALMTYPDFTWHWPERKPQTK